MLKRLLATSVAGTALAVALVGPVAAQNQAGNSLVNVQLSDVTIAVPISIAANLCDINVNVLAAQVRGGDTDCDADAQSIATPGTGDGTGGGNQAGDSLVNVQVDDLFVLLPVAVAANVCDVNANVLAQQLRLGEAACTATADSEA